MKLPGNLFSNIFRNRVEQDKRPRLTSQEMWDFIFWSFFYSRGRSIVQVLMFEYLNRNFILDKKFDIERIPENIISKTVSLRQSTRHAYAEPEVERTEQKEIFESSRSELSRFGGMLKKTTFGRNFFAKASDTVLMSLFASSLIMIDYNWICKNGSKVSNIKNFFFNKEVTMVGGNVFEKMKSDLFKYLERAITSQEKIDQSVTEVYEGSPIDSSLDLVELSQKQMWEEIEQKLSAYAKRT